MDARSDPTTAGNHPRRPSRGRLDGPEDVEEAIWLLRLAHALLRLAREPGEAERELQGLTLSDELRQNIDIAQARWAA